MYWFRWLEIFNSEKDTIKSKNLLMQSHTSHTDTKLKDFRVREAIHVEVRKIFVLLHLYKSLLHTKECVLNFPSADIYRKCEQTVTNNEYENDEITISGLTAEKANSVNAPRIKECFLNIECELLWEKEQFVIGL